MKSTLLIILIGLTMIAFGQANQGQNRIETICVIGLKRIPDNKIEYSTNGLVIQFSKELIVNNIDEWISSHNKTNDTTEYSQSDLIKISQLLQLTKNYYVEKTNKNLLEPVSIVKNDKSTLEDYSLIAAANNIFHEDVLCKMIENGECKLYSNGFQQKSITKAKVTVTNLGNTDISIRYFSQNSKEIINCCPCENIMSN
jgi:hypothetical protein